MMNSTAHRQAFCYFNRDALPAACMFPQQGGSLVNEVLLGRDTRYAWCQQDLRPVGQVKSQRVAEINELKQGLQVVIAIVPAAGNVQEEIQLGRGVNHQTHEDGSASSVLVRGRHSLRYVDLSECAGR